MAQVQLAARVPLALGRRVRQMGLLAALAMLIVIGFVTMAAFANLLAPHSATASSLADRLRPPVWMEGGSASYPLGTDRVGRDNLSRIIFGARTSLLVAMMALVLGAGVGTMVGITAGYFGGRVDAVLMRLVDVMLSLPIILFALLLAVALGPSTTNVVVAIGLVLWARFARIIRGEVLSLRERDFVALARIAGASHRRIMARHIFPNVLNTLAVLASLQVGFVIIVEASLSFLGAGIPPPTPAWGSMIAQGREYVTTAWWVSVFPGIATMLVVLAFNLFGEWLRDVLDPRLRQL